MQVHRTLPTAKILNHCALTVGTFDGVHRGHQSLISHLRVEANARNLPIAALTFVDMPFCLFQPENCPQLLTLAEEKIAAFSRTTLDHLFIVPFTREIADQTAADFMRFWRDRIGLKLFVGGPDFALGRGREGDIGALKTMGESLGFETLALDGKLLEGKTPISSTRCRGLIEVGQVELAPQFLGRTYRMAGKVVEGDHIGRTIGVPTINVQPHERKCVPQNGVYAIRAIFKDESEARPAVMNIGMRPTVGGLKKQIEFHVLDQTIETAPEKVEIEFIARLREEKRFDGLEALVNQIKLDMVEGRKVLAAANLSDEGQEIGDEYF